MAYKPTNRPVGRPKTKEYQTISLKISQTLLDRVKRYAGLRRQSISELIREGLEWRIGEGDPLAQRYATGDSAEQEYQSNTEIPSWVDRESESTGVLEEIRATLALQATQLKGLAQALAQRTMVSPPDAYDGHPTEAPTPVVSSAEALAPVACDYDPAKFHLGLLCSKQGHAYRNTGQSLRTKRDRCRLCLNEANEKSRQRKKDAVNTPA